MVQKVLQSKKLILHGKQRRASCLHSLSETKTLQMTIKQYCKEHLGERLVEFILDCLNHSILPKFVKEINRSSRDELGGGKHH
jgi:hypothetical protein